MQPIIEVFLTQFASTQNIEPTKLVAAWTTWYAGVIAHPILASTSHPDTPPAAPAAPAPAKTHPKSSDHAKAPKATASDWALNKYTCAQLKEMCREKQLAHTGTKSELIARLIRHENPPVAPPHAVCKFILDENTGDFVHAETRLVMNQSTNQVIGHQSDLGVVEPLNAEDIDNCKHYGLEWDTTRIKVDNSVSVGASFNIESDIESSEE